MQPIESVKVRALAHEKPRIDTREVNEVVRDLLRPVARIYWSDLAVSSLLGWTSFVLFLDSKTLLGHACFFVTAVICLYRALFFIHEISHHSSKELPGFSIAWNLLVGIPIMAPSFLYDVIHLDHHRRHKYGTIQDPEYLPLGKGARLDIVIFLFKTLLFPIALAVRALVLVPIGLLISPFHKWIESNLSALVINESYKRRELSEFERSRMKVIEVVTLAFWIGVISLYTSHVLPAHVFLGWYLLVFAIGFVNQVRTLVAHRYNNEGAEMEYEQQLLDSINIEGGVFTELWAPIGARYHALHHYIPKLPYHSLPEAHRRMKAKFFDNSLYIEVNEPSFASAFKKLWKVIILAILISIQTQPAQSAQADPCVSRIQKSIQGRENISVVKSGIKSVQSFNEVDQELFAPNAEVKLFGRFFQDESQKVIFWMIPYADGKACIVRDIKTL